MPQTLYLKYRPLDFDSVVGQEIPRITIKNASKLGNISHAYLFTGPRGTGKTSMARIVAKTINCVRLKEDGNPCNTCNICTSINEGRNVDIIEIDAASHTSVDDIRDLIDKARFMPNESKKKVYIVDEVHMLSKSAFNALLKTLEEPPEHVHFILATTELYKVPETIISRCQKFDFKRIEIQDIVSRLRHIAEKEGITSEIKALNLIAKISEGGMRNAIGIFERVIRDKAVSYETTVDMLDVTGIHIIEGLYEDIEHKRIQNALTKITDLYEGGASLSQFTKDFIEFLREKMLEAIRQGDSTKSMELLQYIDIFEIAANNLKTSVIPQLPLEIAIARMYLAGKPLPQEEKEKASKKKEEKKEVPKEIKKEEEKKKEDSPAEISKEEPLLLSFENIRKHWDVICDTLEPKFRHAMKNAVPVSLEDTKLSLLFYSKMYYDITNSHAAKTAIESTLQSLFHTSVTIQSAFEKKEKKEEEEDAVYMPLSAEEAADILGGDIVA